MSSMPSANLQPNRRLGNRRCLSLTDAVERSLASQHETTEGWSELTSTRFEKVALTFRGLGSSRATSIARILAAFFIACPAFLMAASSSRSDWNIVDHIPLER